MGFDTTLPGESAEIIKSSVSAPFGSAGVVAIVGRFEKGDGNKPYYFKNPTDGLKKMGASADFPGAKIIEMVFKQDQDNNNPGASAAIAIKAGESDGASCTLKDTSGTPVDVMTLTLTGGVWGNSVTATLGSGTTTGQKLTLKNGTEILDTFDNCADATELYNKIRTRSNLDITVTALDLTKTLATVTDSAFSGGTEVESPTTTDLNNALDVILDENFDMLIFTDIPSDLYYATIVEYLNSKIESDRFARTTLPISTAKSTSEVLVLLNSIDSPLVNWIPQKYTSGSDVLNEAESAARYAGYAAGMVVSQSPTNKIISDITAINTDYNKTEQYLLTDKGATLLTSKDKENNQYGVVSAVTGSHEVDDEGNKTMSEQHAIATFCFVMNYLNMTDKLGQTGFSETKEAIDGEIENRKNELIPDIAIDIQVATSYDEEDDQVLYEDVGVQPKGILKHIHKRGNLITGAG